MEFLIPNKRFILLTFFVTILSSIQLGQAAVFTVCSSGCDSTTIQGGINMASAYDEVRLVEYKEYNENVTLNVTGVTLTSNTSTRPVIWFNQSSPVINVSANNVTVKNLYVKQNGTNVAGSMGVVDARNVVNLTLVNLNVSHTGGYEVSPNVYGVYFSNTNSSTLMNSTIYTTGTGTSDSLVAIMLSGSYFNNIENLVVRTGANSIQSSYNSALYISGGSNNHVYNATLTTYSASAPFGPGALTMGSTSFNVLEKVTVYLTSAANQAYGAFFSSISYNKFSDFSVNVLSGHNNNYAIWFYSYVDNNEFYSTNIVGAPSGVGSQPRQKGLVSENSQNNTFYDSSMIAPDFWSQSVGLDIYNSDITLVNSTYDDIMYSGGTVKVYKAHRVSIRVTDSSSGALQGASVTVNDTSSVPDSGILRASFAGTTNSSGYINDLLLNEYYNNSGGTTYLNNHTFMVSKTNYVTNSTQYNITAPVSIYFVLYLSPNMTHLFGKGQDSYELGYDDANSILYSFVNNVNVSGSLQSGWNHVVMTFDSGEIRLYVNGKNVGSSSTSNKPAVNSRSIVVGNGSTFRMDEIRFYSRPLSSPEIEQHYMVGNALKAIIYGYGSGSFGRNFNISAVTSDGLFASRYIAPSDLVAGSTQSVNLQNATGIPSFLVITSNSCNQKVEASEDQLRGVYC